MHALSPDILGLFSGLQRPAEAWARGAILLDACHFLPELSSALTANNSSRIGLESWGSWVAFEPRAEIRGFHIVFRHELVVGLHGLLFDSTVDLGHLPDEEVLQVKQFVGA